MPAADAPEALRPDAHADLLIHARWIAQVDSETLLENHAVAIRAGRIVALLPSDAARRTLVATRTVELDTHILIPGLVNLHGHAAMSLMRGLADDLPLEAWLQKHIWPAEAACVSPEFVYDGTQLACVEMLRGGITTHNDMYFFPDAAARAVSESGMRAVLGMVVLDFPTAYGSDAEDDLAKGLAARDAWRDQPRIGFALAPHAPYTVGDASLEKIRILAAQLDLPIHIHIHETADEVRTHLARHGCRPLARLERLGLLGPQFIGVHAVHLQDEEIASLAKNGCHIAHCPVANLKLGSGIAPLGRLLDQGINVGLGSDGAAGNNRLDLFQEMRIASLLAKGSTQDAGRVPAWQALRMATLNGASALGLADTLGSITPGKCADLVAVRLDAPELSPCFDPVAHLVHCAGREHVTHVWVDGQCCVFDKIFVSCDIANLKNRVRLWQNKLGSRLKSGRD
jgi:5-methylthioadenosine/S-adenosylhomocysteine deaminase